MNRNSKPAEVTKSTEMSPIDYGTVHNGHRGAAVWSMYLFELYLKIQNNGTSEQIAKYNELLEAHKWLVNDAAQVYRLECEVTAYKHLLEKMGRENQELKRQNTMMMKTIEFTDDAA